MQAEERFRLAELKKVSALFLLGLLLTGCGKSSQDSDAPASQKSPAKKQDASMEDDKDATPEQRRYLVAAKPFALAIANRKYEDAYALLSSHAKARMSLNQFSPDDNEAKFAQNEKNPVSNVTVEKFRELMKTAEDRFGTPRSLDHLSVYSTDAAILSRRGKEKLDAVDSMFAIGNMPESVPADIRRASLRGKILTQLSPQELEKIAKQEGTTVAELQKNPDFEPYFTIKIVLVEEEGQLKVGYFEFLPPGIVD